MNADTHAYRLLGAVDPWETSQGFFVPLFARAQSNQCYVQEVSDDGQITGFAPYTVECKRIELDHRETQVGDPAVWAFVFALDDVLWGQGFEGQPALKARLETAFFETRPLLALEVAEFLREEGARVRHARRAFERLSSVSRHTANSWRDLSVLTPDVVRILRELPPQKLAGVVENVFRVVVKTQPDETIAHGVDPKGAEAGLAAVESAIGGVYRSLRILYSDRPTYLPRLRYVATSSQRPKVRDRVAANVMIVDPSLDWLARGLREERLLRVLGPGGDDQAADAPLSVVVRRLEDDFSYGSGPSIGPTTVALRQGQSSRIRPLDEARIERLPRPAVVVDIPRAMSSLASEKTALDNVRNAIGAIIQEPRPTQPMSDGLRFYLQSHGTGPRPRLDGWCQLYARAWKLGLVGGSGARFALSGMLQEEGSASEECARVMFPAADFQDARNPIARGSRRGATCALLMEPSPLKTADRFRLHQRVVEMLLLTSGWEIPDPSDPRRPDRTLAVRGETGWFDCVTRFEETVPTRQVADWAHMEADVFQVGRVIATETASPAQILARLLSHNELLATARDLSLCNPRQGAVISLLAAQARRFANALPSIWRSRFMGLLTHAALKAGPGRLDVGMELSEFISDPAFGRSQHLVCTRVVFEGPATIAHVRAVYGYGAGRYGEGEYGRMERRFQLIFSREGIAIRDAS